MMSDIVDDSNLNPNSEEDLRVVRARTDSTAFASLYDQYLPLLFRYVVRRLFRRDLAEEVTSEVFLHVALHIRDFAGRTETDFRKWLFSIATNSINAYLRQSIRRRKLWEGAVHSRRGSFDTDASSETFGGSNLEWGDVYRALLDLDERDRSIVNLRFFADCSYDEIGEIVGCSAGAVRTALSRVISKLRKQFSKRVSD